MGIEVVDPQEPGSGRSAFQPGPCGGRGQVRGPLHVGRAPPVVAVREVVVVHVEPAGEAEAPVQRETGDEGRRPVSRVVKGLGQGRDRVRQDVIAVVAYPVAKRREAGQDRGVRRRRERHLCDRGREARAAGRERVEHRGGGAGVSVAAQVVGAEGVDRDEQDIGPGCGRGSGTRPRARAGDRRAQDRDTHEPPAPGHEPIVPSSCRICG